MSWTVVPCTLSGSQKLTARSENAATARSTGSDSKAAPGGITAVGRPEKLRSRALPATRLALLERRPTLAAPIRKGVLPISLVRRTRTRLPPTLACTISLSVWLLKLRVLALAGGPAGAVPQVANQLSAGPLAAGATPAGSASAAVARAGPARRKPRRDSPVNARLCCGTSCSRLGILSSDQCYDGNPSLRSIYPPWICRLRTGSAGGLRQIEATRDKPGAQPGRAALLPFMHASAMLGAHPQELR